MGKQIYKREPKNKPMLWCWKKHDDVLEKEDKQYEKSIK